MAPALDIALLPSSISSSPPYLHPLPILPVSLLSLSLPRRPPLFTFHIFSSTSSSSSSFSYSSSYCSLHSYFYSSSSSSNSSHSHFHSSFFFNFILIIFKIFILIFIFIISFFLKAVRKADICSSFVYTVWFLKRKNVCTRMKTRWKM